MTDFPNLEETHARLSPSKAHRWMLCPGSIREEAKYPETNGQAAIDGTHSHTLLEECVNRRMADPLTMIGQTYTDHEGTFTVDKDRASRVKIAIDYLHQRVIENGWNCQVISETKVNPDHFIGRRDLAGTVDIQLIAKDVLEIIDYKDGMTPVSAENNHQLILYAVGALAAFKRAYNAPYPFEKVRLTIIQPKLAFKRLPAISSHETTVNALLKNLNQYILAAKATDNPDAPLVPGESQCRFCRAKGGCAAVTTHLMETVGMFKTIDIAQQAADKNPTELSNDQIREIVEAAPLLRQLLEAVEGEAMRRFESGISIEGLKAVVGRGSRSWAFKEDEMAEKLIKMGIPKGSIYVTKLVTPAQAEKLTWEKRDGTKKQLSERQLKTLEQEYIVKSAGKLTIVTESDSRPAVTLNAAPLFQSVEAELPVWLNTVPGGAV